MPKLRKFRIIRRIAGLFALSSLLVATAPQALEAQELFRPASAEQQAAAEGNGGARAFAKRSAIVQLDALTLARHLLPAGSDTAGDRAERSARLDGRVTLRIFPDVAVTLRRNHVEAAQDGGISWIGDVVGHAPGYGLLIINRGQITGQVQVGQRTITIDHVQGLVHRISDIDTAAMPPEAPPRRDPRVRSEAPAGGAAGAAEANVNIDVLVIVTDRAVAAPGNINTQVAQAFSLANLAHRNSATGVTLRRVGLYQVGYNETTRGFEQSLNDLTSSPSVQQLRNQLAADQVVLIRIRGDACGIAWSTVTSSRAYSVVDLACIPGHTFAHELAHNMGALHDRFGMRPQTFPNSQFRFGYVNLQARRRTVLAYNNLCVANGFNCTRIPYFSAPRVVGGVRIGIAAGQSGAADNTRVIVGSKTFVSQYRRRTGSAPELAPAAFPLPTIELGYHDDADE